MKIYDLNRGMVVQMLRSEILNNSTNTQRFDALILDISKNAFHDDFIMTYINLKNFKTSSLVIGSNLKGEYKDGRVVYEVLRISTKSVEDYLYEFNLSEEYILHKVTYSKSRIDYESTKVCCTDVPNRLFIKKYTGEEFEWDGHPLMVGRGKYGIEVYYISKY